MSYCCIDAAGEIELVNANDFPPVDLGIANFAELDDEDTLCRTSLRRRSSSRAMSASSSSNASTPCANRRRSAACAAVTETERPVSPN